MPLFLLQVIKAMEVSFFSPTELGFSGVDGWTVSSRIFLCSSNMYFEGAQFIP